MKNKIFCTKQTSFSFAGPFKSFNISNPGYQNSNRGNFVIYKQPFRQLVSYSQAPKHPILLIVILLIIPNLAFSCCINQQAAECISCPHFMLSKNGECVIGSSGRYVEMAMTCIKCRNFEDLKSANQWSEMHKIRVNKEKEENQIQQERWSQITDISKWILEKYEKDDIEMKEKEGIELSQFFLNKIVGHIQQHLKIQQQSQSRLKIVKFYERIDNSVSSMPSSRLESQILKVIVENKNGFAEVIIQSSVTQQQIQQASIIQIKLYFKKENQIYFSKAQIHSHSFISIFLSLYNPTHLLSLFYLPPTNSSNFFYFNLFHIVNSQIIQQKLKFQSCSFPQYQPPLAFSNHRLLSIVIQQELSINLEKPIEIQQERGPTKREIYRKEALKKYFFQAVNINQIIKAKFYKAYLDYMKKKFVSTYLMGSVQSVAYRNQGLTSSYEIINRLYSTKAYQYFFFYYDISTNVLQFVDLKIVAEEDRIVRFLTLNNRYSFIQTLGSELKKILETFVYEDPDYNSNSTLVEVTTCTIKNSTTFKLYFFKFYFPKQLEQAYEYMQFRFFSQFPSKEDQFYRLKSMGKKLYPPEVYVQSFSDNQILSIKQFYFKQVFFTKDKYQFVFFGRSTLSNSNRYRVHIRSRGSQYRFEFTQNWNVMLLCIAKATDIRQTISWAPLQTVNWIQDLTFADNSSYPSASQSLQSLSKEEQESVMNLIYSKIRRENSCIEKLAIDKIERVNNNFSMYFITTSCSKSLQLNPIKVELESFTFLELFQIKNQSDSNPIENRLTNEKKWKKYFILKKIDFSNFTIPSLERKGQKETKNYTVYAIMKLIPVEKLVRIVSQRNSKQDKNVSLVELIVKVNNLENEERIRVWVKMSGSESQILMIQYPNLDYQYIRSDYLTNYSDTLISTLDGQLNKIQSSIFRYLKKITISMDRKYYLLIKFRKLGYYVQTQVIYQHQQHIFLYNVLSKTKDDIYYLSKKFIYQNIERLRSKALNDKTAYLNELRKDNHFSIVQSRIQFAFKHSFKNQDLLSYEITFLANERVYTVVFRNQQNTYQCNITFSIQPEAEKITKSTLSLVIDPIALNRDIFSNWVPINREYNSQKISLIPNCIWTQNLSYRCKNCKQGFSAEKDGLCYPEIEGCKIQTYNLCLSCREGYILTKSFECS